MTTRTLTLLGLAVALAVLPSCIEMRQTITLNARGGGVAVSELAIEKMVLGGRSVEDLKRSVIEDGRKDGASIRFVSQREEGSKVVLVAEQRFSACSELGRDEVEYDCFTGEAGPGRRVHRLRVTAARTLPGSFTVTARLPGRVDLTNGTPAPGGGVTWSVDATTGPMYAVSSTRGLPPLGSLTLGRMALAGAALLFAGAGIGGFVWLAPRVPPWLRKQKRFCSKCGRRAGGRGRFCNGCGAALPAGRVPTRPPLGAPLALGCGASALAFVAASMLTPREGPREVVEGLVAAVGEGRLAIAQAAYLGGDLFTASEGRLRARLGGLGGPGEVRVEQEEANESTAQLSLVVVSDEGTRRPVKATLERGPGGWRVTRWDATAPPAGWERLDDGQALARCSGPSGDRVLAELQEAIRANPKDAALAALAGVCHERAGGFEAAERAYRAAMAIYPDRVVGAAHSLARLYEKQEAPEKAEATWREILGTKPDDEVALLSLARMLTERGSTLDEAVSLARKALALRPDEASVLATLGWACYRKGDRADAAKYLGEAVQKEPGNAVYRARLDEATTTADDLVRRAQEKHAGGRFDEAIAAYDAALRKEPGHATAQPGRAAAVADAVRSHLAAAEQLLEAGRYDDALAECDRALHLAPGDAAAAATRQRIAETKRILGS
jgi:tetratricopeptide (TPR) repeat protein